MTIFEVYGDFGIKKIYTYNDLEYTMIAIKTEDQFYLKDEKGTVFSCMIDMRRKTSRGHPALITYVVVKSSEGEIPDRHVDYLYGMHVADGKLKIYLENPCGAKMLATSIPIANCENMPNLVDVFNEFLMENGIYTGDGME